MTFYFDGDQDPDTDASFYFDADQDPDTDATFYFVADPDHSLNVGYVVPNGQS